MKDSVKGKKSGRSVGFDPVSSAGDCTGLIPAGIKKEEELEAYEEMYNFLPPEPEPGSSSSGAAGMKASGSK